MIAATNLRWRTLVRLCASRLAIAMLGLVGLFACSGSAADLAVDRVVFISIDTLRADHLRSFGYPTDTAPFVDSLAARGTSFKRAYAHSATTGPSHASMFTGLYPIQHRLLTNGQVLANEFVTTQEVFGDNGFMTAAFVSGDAHFDRSRIAQGFEVYDQPQKGDTRATKYRTAERTTDAAIAWLDEAQLGAERPLYMWIHYCDPHKPLRPPTEHLDAVTPPDEEALAELVRYLIDEQASDLRRAQGQGKRARQILDYDAEIHFADSQIERLYQEFQERGLAENTLWVITSDHGQGLANHEWFGHHKQIYNVQLHVPLIFYLEGGGGAQGEIVDRIVEHVDLAPTLLDFAGLRLEGQTAPVQGRSLLPMLVGDTSAVAHEFSFAARRQLLAPGLAKIYHQQQELDELLTERPEGVSDEELEDLVARRKRAIASKQRQLGGRFLGKESQETGEKYSLQTLRYKYIGFANGPAEFFDLETDPYESVNLIGEATPALDELKQKLVQMVAELSTRGVAETVDDATMERLRSLGYIQ